MVVESHDMSESHRGEMIAKVVMAIWTAVGPLVGVFVGAYIANRNQRKHWVGNCKKEEYRELYSGSSPDI